MKASQSPREHAEHDEAVIGISLRNRRSSVPLPWHFPNQVAVDSSRIRTVILQNVVSSRTLNSQHCGHKMNEVNPKQDIASQSAFTRLEEPKDPAAWSSTVSAPNAANLARFEI